MHKRNSYTTVLNNGEFFQIETYICLGEACFGLGYYLSKSNLSIVPNLPHTANLQHITPVEKTNLLSAPSAVDASQFKSLVIFVEDQSAHVNWICKQPNQIETNL